MAPPLQGLQWEVIPSSQNGHDAPIQTAYPIEENPENEFWENSLNEGAQRTNGFFDGEVPLRRRVDSDPPTPVEPRRPSRSEGGVLGPLGFFCACATNDDDQDIHSNPSFFCNQPAADDH